MSIKTVVAQDDITIIEKTVKIVSTDPVSPVTDEFWYNSTSNQLKYYNGTVIVVGNKTRNYSTYPTPIDINAPINLTGAANIDWSLGKVFYKPDVNGDVTFTFSNTTDKEIVVIVEPTLAYYNTYNGINISFPQPFYSDNYSGFNTTPLSLPSPALYGLFYISSKNGKIYIKNYNVNSNQPVISTKQTWAWGYSGSGELGYNATGYRSSPVLVVGSHNFINIAGGYYYALGLKADGSLWGWGYNADGELGLNIDTNNRSSPVLVQGNHNFINTAAGNSQSFGIKADGSAWAWGYNNYGVLGHNDTPNRSSPVLVVGGHSFLNITNGLYHSLGLKADGNAWGWGGNEIGTLGHNDIISRSSPVLVVGGHSFVNISAGYTHSLGIKTNGNVWAWGYNPEGELGYNDTINRSSPVLVVGSHSFISIAGGYNHSLGLKADGNVWSWGRNTYGQLGYNDTTWRSSPVLVQGNHSFVNIVAGNSHTLGIKADGSAWTWGYNYYGQLGHNDTNHRSSPVQVIGNIYFTKNISNQNSGLFGIQR